MCVITTVKLYRQRTVCIRSWQLLLQISALVYPLGNFFSKKIGAAVPLGPTIPAAGVAGLFDFHFGQFGKAGLQPLPDPVSEIFARGIL